MNNFPRAAFLSFPLIFGFSVMSCADSPYRPLIGESKSHETIVIQNVRLFDAIDSSGSSGSITQEEMDIIIRDGKIAAIGKTGSLDTQDGFIVDGSGKTLLPGFIDTHVHMIGSGEAPWQSYPIDVEHNLHGWLYSGVTTVFDLGGFPGMTGDWQQSVQTGETLGPNIYRAGYNVTAKGSHPIPIAKELAPFPINLMVASVLPQIKNAEEAKTFVASMMEENVDFIKAVVDDIPSGSPKMNRDTLSALVEESHANGLKILVHISHAEDAVMAAEVGADALTHGVIRDELSVEQAKIIADANVPVIYTLSGWQALALMIEGKYEVSAINYDISPAGLLRGVELESGKAFAKTPVAADMATQTLKGRQYWRQNIINLRDAGVIFLVGTDSPLPGVYPGGSYHDEMASLVEAGIAPAQILLGATSRAAKWLDKDSEFGTIEVGKQADLVLIDGNPLEDILRTTQIEMVIKSGVIVNRLMPQTQPN